jgi:DNA mismatch repair protein MutH
MTFTRSPLPYDHTQAGSIEAYAQQLVSHTLRAFVPPERILRIKDKGEFGNLLEEFYFFKKPDSSPKADFPEAGVELKSTPLERQVRLGLLVPKERLVLSMIDYFVLRGEKWSSNSVFLKSALLLLIFYLWEESKSPVDLEVRLARLWKMPPEDLHIIRKDWESIVKKVNDGLAHTISETDTLYLAACTKGGRRRPQPCSSELAKSRAFALKQSYVRAILHSQLGYKVYEPVVKEGTKLKREETFEDIVQRRFHRYIGKSADQIARKVGIKPSEAKHSFALVTRAILKIAPGHEIEEFEKAGILERTLRINRQGTIEQHVSFPAFDYLELAKERWQTSELREQLTSRFFFVVFEEDSRGVYRLRRTMFWSMPEEDREREARAVWLKTVRKVRRGNLEKLPKIVESRVAHVRPHDSKKKLIYPGPRGSIGEKKCFWLRNKYVLDVLKKSKGSK